MVYAQPSLHHLCWEVLAGQTRRPKARLQSEHWTRGGESGKQSRDRKKGKGDRHKLGCPDSTGLCLNQQFLGPRKTFRNGLTTQAVAEMEMAVVLLLYNKCFLSSSLILLTVLWWLIDEAPDICSS